MLQNLAALENSPEQVCSEVSPMAFSESYFQEIVFKTLVFVSNCWHLPFLSIKKYLPFHFCRMRTTAK